MDVTLTRWLRALRNRSFYRLAGKDPVLKNVAGDLYGLRLLTIPDLFEAICWAIIGQQINLRFAYTLKKRFVESFGEKFTFRGGHYYLFPIPQKIAGLKISDIRSLQFTARKSEYIIDLAQKMITGNLTREGLLRHDNFQAARKELMRIRGVGEEYSELLEAAELTQREKRLAERLKKERTC